MLKHLIILYTTFIILPISSFAQGQEETISSLSIKCEKARSLSQYEKLDTYSSQLLDLAKQKKDKRAETYAYFYNGLSKLFNGKGDESQKMHDKAESMSVEIGNDSVRALVYNAKGIYHAMMQNNSFVAQQYFIKSLELAKKVDYEELCHRVRGNLLTLSHSMGDSIAYEIATEVYEFGQKQQNDEQLAMGSYYLASYFYSHDNFVETEKYLKVALDTYEKYPYEDIASVYLLYAKMQITQGKYDKAEGFVKQAITLAQKYKQVSMEVEGEITYAELLNKKHKYQESNDMLEHAIQLAESIELSSKEIDCNQLMAKNFMALDKKSEAIACLEKANNLLSEKGEFNMQRLSHELRIMRDIEKTEMEAKLRKEQIAAQRKVMIMLFVVVVILLVLLAFIIMSNRRKKELYKQIVKQNTRYVARQEDLQLQIDALLKEKKDFEQKVEEVDKPAKKESFVMGDDKINSLYTELCRLMENERLYTEAQLTREKMAERLGTNRTYLIKVIKEKTNMNYLQFVNSYRINEAIKILSNKDMVSYPLKQIWSDLGFSSPSTFFKLFQQAVGITPSTYRKQFLEVNSETKENDDEDDNLV